MKKLRPYQPPAEATLHEVLAALGYTTAPRDREIWQGKKILRGSVLAHQGTADETWTWLRRTGQIV